MWAACTLAPAPSRRRWVAQVSAAVDGALCTPSESALVWTLIGHPVPLTRPRLRVERPLAAEAETLPQLDLADAQRLRAAIDQLQVTLSGRWRRQLQAAGVWMSGLFGVLLTQAGGIRVQSQPRYLFVALLLGGPLSWVVRDLSAALERLRG
jgi:hypothetical protein